MSEKRIHPNKGERLRGFNHANKRIGVCLKEAASKLEVDLHNARQQVAQYPSQQAQLSKFIDCLKLHARHGYKRVTFTFHLPDYLRQFCEQEGIGIVYGVNCCVVKWA